VRPWAHLPVFPCSPGVQSSILNYCLQFGRELTTSPQHDRHRAVNGLTWCWLLASSIPPTMLVHKLPMLMRASLMPRTSCIFSSFLLESPQAGQWRLPFGNRWLMQSGQTCALQHGQIWSNIEASLRQTQQPPAVPIILCCLGIGVGWVGLAHESARLRVFAFGAEGTELVISEKHLPLCCVPGGACCQERFDGDLPEGTPVMFCCAA